MVGEQRASKPVIQRPLRNDNKSVCSAVRRLSVNIESGEFDDRGRQVIPVPVTTLLHLRELRGSQRVFCVSACDDNLRAVTVGYPVIVKDEDKFPQRNTVEAREARRPTTINRYLFTAFQ